MISEDLCFHMEWRFSKSLPKIHFVYMLFIGI
ncbi:MAG: hypothetical protein A4E45_00070 [Methanosaeta sp. PtaB.Bin039]|nr:MAG: hypothetical protein A4E45_00070 [Methanosaeta sp. PtaB.Bin039]